MAAFPGVSFHQENDAFRVISPLIADVDGFLLDDILQFSKTDSSA
jgi:hypothetical protein